MNPSPVSTTQTSSGSEESVSNAEIHDYCSQARTHEKQEYAGNSNKKRTRKRKYSNHLGWLLTGCCLSKKTKNEEDATLVSQQHEPVDFEQSCLVPSCANQNANVEETGVLLDNEILPGHTKAVVEETQDLPDHETSPCQKVVEETVDMLCKETTVVGEISYLPENESSSDQKAVIREVSDLAETSQAQKAVVEETVDLLFNETTDPETVVGEILYLPDNEPPSIKKADIRETLPESSCHKAVLEETSPKINYKKGKKKEPSKAKKENPNYFVAIQVDSKYIKDALQTVQDSILQHEPVMKKAMIPLSTLHITLVVMHIGGPDDLQRASEALIASFDKVKNDLNENPLYLKFQGLSNFKKKVLFADLKKDENFERLSTLYEEVVSSFELHKFSVRERDTFTPHLTITKLSKAPQLYRKGIKTISPLWYEGYDETEFGSQFVGSLQLLSMLEPHDDQGYYQCKQECFFDNPVTKQLTKSSEAKQELLKNIRDLTSKKLEEKVDSWKP